MVLKCLQFFETDQSTPFGRQEPRELILPERPAQQRGIRFDEPQSPGDAHQEV